MMPHIDWEDLSHLSTMLCIKICHKLLLGLFAPHVWEFLTYAEWVLKYLFVLVNVNTEHPDSFKIITQGQESKETMFLFGLNHHIWLNSLISGGKNNQYGVDLFHINFEGLTHEQGHI